MSSSVRQAAAVGAVLAAVVASAGAAAGAPRSTAPLPTLASMALSPADFAAGAKVATQRSVTSGGFSTFMRVFRPGARLGTRPLLEVVSQVTLFPNVDEATAAIAELRRETRTKAGRRAVAKQLT